MRIFHMRKTCRFVAIIVLFSYLQACGLGGLEDECDNPHPSQQAQCDEKGSSEWNNMKWGEGAWQ